MEKSNSKGGLVIGILIGIIIMLIVGIGLFATNTVNFSGKTDNQKNETIKDVSSSETVNKIVGEYTYSKEYPTDAVVYNLALDLMRDGTFYVIEGSTTGFYSFGTYEISDNSIKLNTQFKMSNVPGEFSKVNKIATYELDSNGKIVVNNVSDSPFNGSGDDEFLLTKSSDDCKSVKDFTNHFIELLDISKK